MLDITSAGSIIDFAKLLKNQTLRQACGSEIEKHGYKGKGNFGQILEKFYFGYEPNSDAEPDFKEAGIELKSSPLKTLKNGDFRSKERLVLNIINYLEVHKEEFETSSFWKKNAHLLLVFYLHDKDLDLLDYFIKLVDGWQYPNEDLKIIKKDWEFINQKIKKGKAHELSEGDTFYLGACTKGSTALRSFRNQPFNEEQAKQRAYSLKQGVC
uniref:MutH/Sau3AI family endonuclease n=1 Tax=Mariniflexile sp. TaxID=1979402 RepID=UPI004047A288